MISLEEAREAILGSITPLESEEVLLANASRKFVRADLLSRIDLPPFDNSAMDGYAVCAADLKNAASASPVLLACAGRIGAGEKFLSSVSPGTCVRIFTGSVLPDGADAVVMQEDATREGGSVRFTEPAQPFENIRLKGEDIRSGALLLGRGEQITPVCAGLLAAAGYHTVPVGRAPRVAILATGNELREPGHSLQPGEIYESNRTLLAFFLRELGCIPSPLPLVRDDLRTTIVALEQAFDQNDLVISTGGVSVGEFDFVKEGFAQLGGQIDLWKLALRPGKPFVFGRHGKKFLFGLPGNPVSTLVTFLLLVRPALLSMLGAAHIELPLVEGELAESVTNRGDRRHFMRVRWHEGKVTVSGPQASHMLGSLGGANGLLEVPPGQKLEVSSRVQVHLWNL